MGLLTRDTGRPVVGGLTTGPGGWKMYTKGMLLSEQVRKRVQLGMIPVLVGAIGSLGADGLIELAGVAQAIAVLGLLIGVQIYLIVARVRVDLLGASG